MSLRNNFRHTIAASYIGYITQAIVNNFLPLLFVTFNKSFGISLTKISFLITLNFSIQLAVDLLSAKFVDKIGYRAAVVAAHFSASFGLILLGILPYSIDPYKGLLISVLFTAIGGGLTEVVVSPIVEACPTSNKSASMSLLHSFYSWGQVLVTVLSTIYFIYFGIVSWRILSLFWALVPLLNAIYYCFVPINKLIENDKIISAKILFKDKIFYLFLLLMLCAGACEIAMSQWASTFAEVGLGVSKSIGDLLGPTMFAVLMGISRVLYATLSNKIDLTRYILYSGLLCIICYSTVTFSKNPVLFLMGCAVCGLSVGIMWPGVYSLASKKITTGGTMMFAFLALAGDLGCTSGPTLVGIISDKAGNNLQLGFAFALIFPIVLTLSIIILRRKMVFCNEQ